MTFSSLQELFADESRWTTGTLARDANGKHVSPEEESATCYCLVGGAVKVYGAGYVAALEKVRDVTGVSSGAFGHFNDHATIADIRRVCAEAGV